MSYSARQPVGHLSPDLDGPACGAKGRVRMHQPGLTILCVQCVCMLEEPSSGRILAKQIRNREWQDAWLRWAMGSGSPYPSYRDYYVSGDREEPVPNVAFTRTSPNSVVTFRADVR
jgi:hypothetical protein